MRVAQKPMEQKNTAVIEIKKPLSSFTDLVKKSLEIYGKVFWKCIAMMLLPVLAALPTMIIILLMVGFKNSVAQAIFGLLLFISIIFVLVVAIISQSGLFIVIKRNHEKIDFYQALKQGYAYAWRFFIINLAVSVFVFLWSLLLLIPGLIMAGYYAFAKWSLFDEKFESTAGLKRSKELIKDYWWAVVGRLIILFLIVMVIMIIPSALIEATKSNLLNNIWAIINQVFSIVLTPFIVIFTYLMYRELLSIKGPSKLSDHKGKSPAVIILSFVAILVVLTLIIVGIIMAIPKNDNFYKSSFDSQNMNIPTFNPEMINVPNLNPEMIKQSAPVTTD